MSKKTSEIDFPVTVINGERVVLLEDMPEIINKVVSEFRDIIREKNKSIEELSEMLTPCFDCSNSARAYLDEISIHINNGIDGNYQYYYAGAVLRVIGQLIKENRELKNERSNQD